MRVWGPVDLAFQTLGVRLGRGGRFLVTRKHAQCTGFGRESRLSHLPMQRLRYSLLSDTLVDQSSGLSFAVAEILCQALDSVLA